MGTEAQWLMPELSCGIKIIKAADQLSPGFHWSRHLCTDLSIVSSAEAAAAIQKSDEDKVKRIREAKN